MHGIYSFHPHTSNERKRRFFKFVFAFSFVWLCEPWATAWRDYFCCFHLNNSMQQSGPCREFKGKREWWLARSTAPTTTHEQIKIACKIVRRREFGCERVSSFSGFFGWHKLRISSVSLLHFVWLFRRELVHTICSHSLEIRMRFVILHVFDCTCFGTNFTQMGWSVCDSHQIFLLRI